MQDLAEMSFSRLEGRKGLASHLKTSFSSKEAFSKSSISNLLEGLRNQVARNTDDSDPDRPGAHE